MSLDVPPQHAVPDGADGRLRNAVPTRQDNTGGSRRTNHPDLLGRQNRTSMGGTAWPRKTFTQYAKSMPFVFTSSGPFQVLDTIVQFFAVLVIDPWLVFRVRQKRQSHETMHLLCSRTAIPMKRHCGVSF